MRYLSQWRNPGFSDASWHLFRLSTTCRPYKAATGPKIAMKYVILTLQSFGPPFLYAPYIKKRVRFMYFFSSKEYMTRLNIENQKEGEF
jgi:hypothetical protein